MSVGNAVEERWTCEAAADCFGQLAAWRAPWPGRPLVVVHGLQDSWRSFLALAQRLAGRYRCYALDMPWRAGSGRSWRNRWSAASCVARGMELVHEPGAAVLGHSFGASAVLHWLAAEPGAHPPGAILAAPFYRPAAIPPTPPLRDRALAAFARIIEDGLRVRLSPRQSALETEIFDCMSAKLRGWLVPELFPVFYREFINSGRLNLASVTTRTLVLGGTEDVSLAPAWAAALVTAMPTASLRLRPTYSHFCHLEQVDDLAADVCAFLDRPVPISEEQSDDRLT